MSDKRFIARKEKIGGYLFKEEINSKLDTISNYKEQYDTFEYKENIINMTSSVCYDNARTKVEYLLDKNMNVKGAQGVMPKGDITISKDIFVKDISLHSRLFNQKHYKKVVKLGEERNPNEVPELLLRINDTVRYIDGDIPLYISKQGFRQTQPSEKDLTEHPDLEDILRKEYLEFSTHFDLVKNHDDRFFEGHELDIEYHRIGAATKIFKSDVIYAYLDSSELISIHKEYCSYEDIEKNLNNENVYWTCKREDGSFDIEDGILTVKYYSGMPASLLNEDKYIINENGTLSIISTNDLVSSTSTTFEYKESEDPAKLFDYITYTNTADTPYGKAKIVAETNKFSADMFGFTNFEGECIFNMASFSKNLYRSNTKGDAFITINKLKEVSFDDKISYTYEYDNFGILQSVIKYTGSDEDDVLSKTHDYSDEDGIVYKEIYFPACPWDKDNKKFIYQFTSIKDDKVISEYRILMVEN